MVSSPHGIITEHILGMYYRNKNKSTRYDIISAESTAVRNVQAAKHTPKHVYFEVYV